MPKEYLNIYRLLTDINRVELGKLLGVTGSYIHAIEAGVKPFSAKMQRKFLELVNDKHIPMNEFTEIYALIQTIENS